MNIIDAYFSEDEVAKLGFASIGKNVKIKKNVGIVGTENISIGDNVRIDDFTMIMASGVPCRIGSYVHIAAHCTIYGRAGFVMEDFSTLSPGTRLFTLSDDYSGQKLTNPLLPSEYVGGAQGTVTLKKHVIIGANSVILPDLTIGEGTSVGAMSLVKKDLDPWGIYAGIPVRRLKDRKKDLLEIEKRLLSEQ